MDITYWYEVGWDKQKGDTNCSGGAESTHHSGMSADTTENPPQSMQNHSEILKQLGLARGALGQAKCL